MASKLKIGDDVVVIAGKDKGKSGKILRFVHRTKPFGEDLWVVVEGIHVVTKHKKKDPHAGKPGMIIKQEAPIHSSNILLKNAETGKPDRVGFKVLEDGKKVRFYKSTGAVVADRGRYVSEG